MEEKSLWKGRSKNKIKLITSQKIIKNKKMILVPYLIINQKSSNHKSLKINMMALEINLISFSSI